VGRPGLTDEVLAWGVPRLRDLPWRRTRDPWAVLVSEVMLQQTQVARVIPAWQAFMSAFPDPSACAAAPLGDVLRRWQGLGYPRRARSLHVAATEVVRLGSFPSTLDGLLLLPGVGPYTARAVLAFSFEIDVAVVDTNIARVLARVEGRRLTARQAQSLADDALAPGASWEWNQAVMDLGATVCRPAAPQCADCPAQVSCAWRGVGPDPAVGSAGVSGRQAPFEGSDRQARGRLMRVLVERAVRESDAAVATQRSPATTARLVSALVTEGLVVRDDGWLRLP
jgi:A/G-specific adenine glycosylase